MDRDSTIHIRMFGCLHTIRKERGLGSSTDVSIPPDGCKAEDIALDLDLPLERIEGVFINHRVYNLDQTVKPGDKVAFIPTGVPGPHRFMLGIYSAGLKA